MIPQKQLTLADIFESDKPQFLSLLENHIDLDSIIPMSFYNHFYASTGRHRKYPLTAMLWALIIQRLFSIPTDFLLLIFLHSLEILFLTTILAYFIQKYSPFLVLKCVFVTLLTLV